MSEKDTKVIDKMPADEHDPAPDAADADLLRGLFAKVQAPTDNEEPEEDETSEKEPEVKKEVKQQPEPAKVETPPEPIKEPEKAPEKSAVDIEAEATKRAQELFEQQRQKLVDEIIRKERIRDESAKKQLKELELATGMTYDQLLSRGRNTRIQEVIDQGYDEQTAKRLVQTEEENARLKDSETQRQREHAIVKLKDEYRDERDRFLNDASLHPEVKALIKEHIKDVDEFAHSSIDDGRKMPFDVALDYQLGNILRKKLPEILDQRMKATEQRVLADVSRRGKVAPEAAGTSVPSTPESTLKPEQRNILKQLGLDKEDIDSVARKRAKRK